MHRFPRLIGQKKGGALCRTAGNGTKIVRKPVEQSFSKGVGPGGSSYGKKHRQEQTTTCHHDSLLSSLVNSWAGGGIFRRGAPPLARRGAPNAPPESTRTPGRAPVPCLSAP